MKNEKVIEESKAIKESIDKVAGEKISYDDFVKNLKKRISNFEKAGIENLNESGANTLKSLKLLLAVTSFHESSETLLEEPIFTCYKLTDEKEKLKNVD